MERDEALQRAAAREQERDFFEEKHKAATDRESRIRLDEAMVSSQLEVRGCF